MNNTRKGLLLASLAAALGMGLMNGAFAYDQRPGYDPRPGYVHPGYVHTVERGWHGDRYWDGHRYWSRNEWERHHPPHHVAPPPHRYY